MTASLEQWVETFAWESETQKKGFLALVLFLRDHRARERDVEFDPTDDTLNAIAAWFIQRDHESNEWWNERIGDLSSRFENEIVSLTESHQRLLSEVDELRAEVAELKRGPA